MNKNNFIALLFLTTSFLTQAMNNTQNGLANINETDLAEHFFSKKNNEIKTLINNKKTDCRPEFYQKFSSRFTAYTGYTGHNGLFSIKESFCKLAKYGKSKDKYCDCDEHGNSEKAQKWIVEKNGDIKVNFKKTNKTIKNTLKLN
ncbi:hypothetical protein KAH94_03340 [bacterium]|nr:hypothetical protein [bacterium]